MTGTGTRLSVVELLPSWPSEPFPQHFAAPVEVRAHVCSSPAAMATTPLLDDELLLEDDDELPLDQLLLLDEDDELELDALLLLDDTSSVVPPLDVVRDHAAVDEGLPPVPNAASSPGPPDARSTTRLLLAPQPTHDTMPHTRRTRGRQGESIREILSWPVCAVALLPAVDGRTLPECPWGVNTTTPRR
jgi:hypothetical protein